MSDTKKPPKTLDILHKYTLPHFEPSENPTEKFVPRVKPGVASPSKLSGDVTASQPVLRTFKFIPDHQQAPPKKNSVLEAAKKVINSRQAARIEEVKKSIRKPPPKKPLIKPSTQKPTPKPQQRRPVTTQKTQKEPPKSRFMVDRCEDLEIPPPKPDVTFIFKVSKKHIELPLIFFSSKREVSETSVGIETDTACVGNSCRDQAFQVMETEHGITEVDEVPPSEFCQQVEGEDIQQEIGKLIPNDFSLQVDSEQLLQALNTPKEIEIQADSENIENEIKLITPQHASSQVNIHEFSSREIFLQTDPERVMTYEDFMQQPPPPATPKEKPKAKLEDIKEKAKIKEEFMRKRRESALLIQKHFKGYKQRKLFRARITHRRRAVLMQRLKEVAERIIKNKAALRITKVMRRFLEARKAEKSEIFQMFLGYSASFIQRTWRNHKRRKTALQILRLRIYSKSLISALVSGYKTRQILGTRHMRDIKSSILDMQELYREVSDKDDDNSLYMKTQIEKQTPHLKRKLMAEFSRLYLTGIWMSLRKTEDKTIDLHKSLHIEESIIQHIEEPTISIIEETPSFDREKPVKPLQLDFNEIAEKFAEDSAAPPVPTNTNFLRKGASKKYDPMLSAKRGSSRSPSKDEISIQEIPEEDSAPKFNFLKRKSKTYQPQKINWKVQSRIDCWSKTKPKKTPKRVFLDNTVALGMLEDVFEDLLKGHLDSSGFFNNTVRNEDSAIPQFTSDSFFITHYTEEIYQEMLEALDNHYNYLCSDEFTVD